MQPNTIEGIQTGIAKMQAENLLKSTNDQIHAQNIEKIHALKLRLESEFQVDAETGEGIDEWDEELDKEDNDEIDQPNSPFQKTFHAGHDIEDDGDGLEDYDDCSHDLDDDWDD